MDEQAFLNAIRANPTDDTTRLVYADWLDERDDPRGEFLRLLCDLRRVQARLTELCGTIPTDWVAAVTPLCEVVIVHIRPEKLLSAVKLVRELTGQGLVAVRELLSSTPATIKSGLTFGAAVKLVGIFEDVAEVMIRPTP